MRDDLLALAERQRAWHDETRIVIYRWIVEWDRGVRVRVLCRTRAEARRERDRLNRDYPLSRYVVRRLPVAILASANEARWME